MRNIVWSKKAAHDYIDTFQYLIDNRGVETAELVKNRLDDAIQKLALTNTGRAGRVRGTFEKVVLKTSYIIAYRTSETTLQIARIIHTSRDWQEDKFPNLTLVIIIAIHSFISAFIKKT